MTRLGSVHDIPHHRPSVLPSPSCACRAPWCGPVEAGRDGRPSPPVGAPHPPGSRRRASARCAAWQVAHAESFACRGSVRGTVRDAITNANYVPLLHPRMASRAIARAPLPCPVATPPRAACRVPWCGPVAVGRDVPIAPPRLGAVRGLASSTR